MGEILSSIGQVIEMGLRAAFYSIGSFVYQAIIYMYNLFEKLCNGRFLDSELLESFSERIGLILGLLMLFIVIFSMIKMVLDPDKITDKEMGASSLIKKLVIVIVMLGTSGFVFDALYTVQKLIIENNVISKLLLPVQLDDKTSENFGAILSEELLFAFYHVNEFNGEPPADVSKCESVVNNLRNDIILYQDFALGKVCLNTTTKVNVDGEDTDMYIINYNWIFSVGVGCVVLYLLFMYCISIGTRMIQLMFLEIIAPMAIVSYVLPKKDTMFSKWTKMYIATYIDVFIRIAIINFIVFIISTLFVTDGAGFAIFWDSIGGKPTGAEHKFILVIIIIALLTFAKKAPDLLKDLFPAGASKLGFSPSMKNAFGLGALLGGLTGGAIGATAATVRGVGNAKNAIGLLSSGRKKLEGSKFWDKNKSFNQNLANLKKNDKDAYNEYMMNRKKLGSAVAGGIGGAIGATATGLVRGGKAGVNGKNVVDAVKSGQQSQAKANLAYADRKAKGVSMPEAIAESAKKTFGISGSYENVDREKSKIQRVIDAVKGAPSNKMVAEQKENIMQTVAVERNRTNAEYSKNLANLGVDAKVFNDSDSQLVIDFERKHLLDNKKDKTVEEIKELANLQLSLKNELGDNYSNYNEAFVLKKQNDALNISYNEREIAADNLSKTMEKAVFYLNHGTEDSIKELENLEGVKKVGENYYLNGIEITNWGSIKAEIDDYNANNKTNYTSFGQFKEEMARISTESVHVANKKSGS